MQIGDVTTQTLQAALHGLNARRTATEQNIANVETPGYLAKTVDFESSLAAAIANGDPASASFTSGTSSAATNLQGNNVSIDDELTGMKKLRDQGYAPENRVRSLERDAAGLAGQDGSLQADMARSNEAIG